MSNRGIATQNFALLMLCIVLIWGVFAVFPIQGDGLPPFQVVPNTVGYPKAAYIQVVTTQEQVAQIKQSAIRNAHMADIGSALKLGSTGLKLMPSDEMNAPSYHLKGVGPQKNLARNVNGFLFQPDTLLSRDPIQFHLITTSVELKTANRVKHIHNRELLQIGSGITCPTDRCFVTAKSTLETEYSKLTPISELEC